MVLGVVVVVVVKSCEGGGCQSFMCGNKVEGGAGRFIKIVQLVLNRKPSYSRTLYLLVY